MKCIVGIDLERRSETAIALLGRLNFEIEETTLLHVTEPMQMALPYSAYGMFAETDEIFETLHKAGKTVLEDASVVAAKYNLHPRTELYEGYPTRALVEYANGLGAELVAVTSTVHTTIGAVFGGSVARGLAISGNQSLLVVRQDVAKEGPVRAVFATDQSPYCADCMKLLAAMAPKGISHLTLLTVYERAKHEGRLALMRGGSHQETLDQTAKALEDKGTELAKWMTEQGIQTTSRVVPGNVDETIQNVMGEENADLLIVGSQGHGFMDRLIVGSTSLHQVILEPYPVLVLRPRGHH